MAMRKTSVGIAVSLELSGKAGLEPALTFLPFDRGFENGTALYYGPTSVMSAIMTSRLIAAMTPKDGEIPKIKFVRVKPVTMLVRPHRGSLDDSMKEVEEVVCTRSNLLRHVNNKLSEWCQEFTADQLKVEPYGRDDRIGWDLFIVSLEGYGVYGFCNKMPEDK